MPELAEVEVICKNLDKKITGKSLSKVDLFLPRILRRGTQQELVSLCGNTISSIRRRGKYILITFVDGQVLLIHLRMTGRLVYYTKGVICDDAYERVRFTFSNGDYMIYGDTRTLGGVAYFPSIGAIDSKGFLSLGIEPLSKLFTGKKCYELAKKSNAPMKVFLLRQDYIAGLGNIYADEALFLSGIHPKRPASSLSQEEAKKLHRVIRKILRESISRGGTTFRDYRNGEGKKGNNQKFLYVYGRGKEGCRRCKNSLQTCQLGGRTTVFCENCQK